MLLTINITPPQAPVGAGGSVAYNFHDFADYDVADPLMNWALTCRFLDLGGFSDLNDRYAATNMPTTMPASGIGVFWAVAWSITGHPRTARHVLRHNLPGTYSFTCHGGFTFVSSSAGRVVFDVTSGGNSWVAISGPTGAMPSNWYVECLRLTDETAFDNTGVPKSHATRVWSPDYLSLAQAKKPSVLRFMKTNHTEVSLVSDRADMTTEDDYSIRAKVPGVSGNIRPELPVEYAVGLCNYLGCDLWWNSGMLNSTACETAVATYVRDNLDAGLKCYYEWCNENWNGGYASPRLCGATWGKLKGTPGAGTASCVKSSGTITCTDNLVGVITASNRRFIIGDFLYDIDETSVSWNGSQTTMTIDFSGSAEQTVTNGQYWIRQQWDNASGQAIEAVRHAKPWNDVWTAGGRRSDLVITYGAQLYNIGAFQGALAADWSEEPDYATIASTHDAVAVNPYFGDDWLNQTDFANMLRANYLVTPGSSAAEIVQYANNEHPTLTNAETFAKIKGFMKGFHTEADSNGMTLVSYEAGTHTVHVGPVGTDAYWTDVMNEYFACMSEPEFITLFQDWMNTQIPYTPHVMQFVLFQLWSRFGNWGEVPEYAYSGDSRTAALDLIRNRGRFDDPNEAPLACFGTQTVNLSAGVGASVDLNDYFSLNTTSFSAASLPSGLTLNTSTGLITGTPSAGTSTHTMTGTNSAGNDTLSMQFVVT